MIEEIIKVMIVAAFVTALAIILFTMEGEEK
jgi:hypothetical protein